MNFSNGMILFFSGVLLLILSFIFLFVFLLAEKKRKNMSNAGAEAAGDTTAVIHNNGEEDSTETELFNYEDSETIPLKDEETKMINS